MSDKETILSLREYIAGQDLRNKRARAIRVNEDEEVVLATPSLDFHGILFNRPNINERVEFVAFGDTIGFFAADVAAGKPLAIDANGELIEATGVAKVIGWAKTAGKAGQPSPVWVNVKGVFDATGGFASIQAEVDAIEVASGLNADGTLPAYSGTNHLNSATSLKSATVLLDTEIGPDVTPVVRTNNPVVAGDPANTNIDKLDGAVGANVTSTTFITTGNTVNQNLSALDAQAATLVIGTTVQAWDDNLQNIADFSSTPADGAFIVGDGSNFTLESGATARASLGLTIGTHVQAWDINLDQIAAFTPTLDNFLVGDGSVWTLETPAQARTSLGLVSGGAGDIWVDTTGDTMTGNLQMGANAVLSSFVPTADNHLANKLYVDSVAQALDTKNSVRAATTANITLSGAQTIDGVSVVAGNRVLVKNQTTGSENGIYVVVDPGAWTRSTDADTSAEVTTGMYTFVSEGTTNADSGWVLITDDPITLDTTSLVFTQFSGAGQITAGVGLLKTGNTLDVNLGAGIAQLPSDEVGIDLYDSATGAIILTTTGSNRSTLTSAQLHLLLDGSSLTQGSAGLKIANAGVTEAHLNTSVAGNGIAGGGGTALSVDPDTVGVGGSKGTLSFNGDKLSVDLGTTSVTAAAGNHTHTLDGLSDVTISGPATSDFLVYNSGEWQNRTSTQAVTHLGLNAGGANDIWTYRAGDTMTGDLRVNAKIGVNRVPVTEVDVQGASDPTIRVMDTTNSLESVLRAKDTLGQVGTNTNHGFDILTNNTARISILNDGKVGIMTSSPFSTFEIMNPGSSAAPAALGASVTPNGNIVLSQNGTSLLSHMGLDSTTAPQYFWWQVRSSVNSSAFNISLNPLGGDVGVGIGTAIASRLHVNELTGGAVNIKITNSETGITATDGLNIGLDSSENAQIWQYENKEIRFATNNSQRAVIDNAGFLGVMESTPTRSLHVSSAADTVVRINAAGSSNSILELTEGNSTTAGQYWHINKIASTHGIRWYNGSVRLFMNASGQLVIGDSTVNNIFEVKGNNSTTLGSPTISIRTQATATNDIAYLGISQKNNSDHNRVGVAAIAEDSAGSGSTFGVYTRNAADGTQLQTTDLRFTISSTGAADLKTGSLSISNVGSGLMIKEGTNAKQGIATLVAGTVTVTTTAVNATSRIMLTGQNLSGTAGELTVSARVASTSFTITSASATDTRDVAWIIFDPA